MKASTELVVNVLDVLDNFGSPDESIDVVSRAIILEVAKANSNGHPARETDIVRSFDFCSHVTVHKRLTKLLEKDLIAATQNPEDRRVQLLHLSPVVQEKIRKLAREIRQLCEN